VRLVTLLRRTPSRRRRALVCRDAAELMTEYLEGALAEPELRRFEGHLARCRACTAHLDQMRTTIATLGHLEVSLLPDAVLDELVGLYRRFRRD